MDSIGISNWEYNFIQPCNMTNKSFYAAFHDRYLCKMTKLRYYDRKVYSHMVVEKLWILPREFSLYANDHDRHENDYVNGTPSKINTFFDLSQ